MNNKQRSALIKAHHQHGQPERDRWDRHHDWYLGRFWARNQSNIPEAPFQDERVENQLTLETNYPYAFVDTMAANICPTNPSVTIMAMNPDMKEVAATREALANHTLRANKIHEVSWRMVSQAAICGFGVTKTIWDKRLSRPVTHNIDPRAFGWDRTVDYRDASYVFEAVPIKKAEFERRMKRARSNPKARYNMEVADKATFSSYPKWLRSERGLHHLSDQAARDVLQWTIVYEFYDFDDGKYLHFIDGCDEPLFELSLPFKYVKNPYDIVVFNPTLRDSSGISDIQLIENSQERLNELDTLELAFAHKCVPAMLMDASFFDNPDEAHDAMMQSSQPGAVVMLRGNQNNIPLSSAIAYLPTPSMAPSWDKMRSVASQNVSFILGLPDYMRGGIGDAKIATEAALADTAIRTRNGRRIKIVMDWVASLAQKYIGYWAQYADPARPIPIRDRGGQDAAFVDVMDLGFDSPETFDNAWWFEFECAPYSPTENNRISQLQRLQQFMPMMVQNPFIDQSKLFAKLLELMGMSELVNKNPQGMMPPQVPGTPGTPGASGAPGSEAMRGPQPVGEQMVSPAPDSNVQMPIVGN